MALATAEAIRDRIYNLIEELTPTTDATRFRRYRNEWGADFIGAAEANPAAMLRRFQVREVSDDEPPEASGVTEERVIVRYQLLIAYPQSHRYGRDNAVDRDDVMNEDWKAINLRVGIYGRGNFSTSTDGSYDATPLGAVRDMERGDGVDLLVIDVPFEFYRATGVEAEEDEEPVVTWSVDATSGKPVPANAQEWADFIVAKGLSIASPGFLHLCQESSGDLADSIGNMTLTKSGSTLYQQSVSGWSRKGVGFVDNATGRYAANAGVGPDPSSESVAFLWIVSMPAAPSGTRLFGGLNAGASSNAFRFNYNSNGTIQLRNGSTINTQNSHANGVRLIFGRYDRTNEIARLYTDLEVVSATYTSSVLDTTKGLGTAAMANITALYMAWWSGADAEMSNAEVKALLEAILGEAVPWS